MEKRLFFYLLLCFSVACSSKKSNNTFSNSVEITFHSSDKAPILASIDLSELEKKETVGQGRFLVSPFQSIEVPLINSEHILSIEYYPLFHGNIIVSKGDKITIELTTGKLSFFKINNDTKEAIATVENQIMIDSPKYKRLQKQILLFLESNKIDKTKSDIAMQKMLELDTLYLNEVFEHIKHEHKSEGIQELLFKFAKVKQYERLSELNAKVGDEVLNDFLKSEYFLNDNILNDRVLSKLLGVYNYYNIVKRPRNKALTEKYKSDFNSFSKLLQGYFKRIVIGILINEKYNRKDICTFIEDYEKNYGKHKDIDAMKQEIEYGVVESKDLRLIGIDNKSETWNTLVHKFKGKKVYVDFWASWCNPCIGELPYSKKIKTELKEVVFIYLALNDKEEAWRKAIVKHNIVSNSYLITNSKSSKFIIDHEIQAIPRYMILDKRGKIINPDAPRPSSDNIKQALKDF